MAEYTVEELRQFSEGLSLRLCSLRSAEHWGGNYSEQIAWLERLREKAKADIKEKEIRNGRN